MEGGVCAAMIAVDRSAPFGSMDGLGSCGHQLQCNHQATPWHEQEQCVLGAAEETHGGHAENQKTVSCEQTVQRERENFSDEC